MAAASIERQHFRRVCAKYATGITILTVLDPDGVAQGMTVNSFTSVSLEPPLILVCIDRRTSILRHFRLAARFAVNVLAEEHQPLSARFALSGLDRFEGVEWTRGHTGAPVLPDMLASLECAVVQMVDAGDHVVVIGEALHATWREGKPLLYFNSSYRKLQGGD